MPEEVQEIHVLLITNCVGPYLFLRNEGNYYLCYMIQHNVGQLKLNTKQSSI